MHNDAKQQQLEFMSKQEGRKLAALGVVLVVGLGYLFTKPHVPLPAEDDMPGVAVQPTGQDPRRVLDILRRVEEEEREGVAHVVTRTEVDPDVLASVEDFALDVIEEPAFHQMVAKVHGMSDEAIATAPEAGGTWTWDQLRTDVGRAQARGKFAKLQGRFWTPLFQRVLEEYPNEAGLAWVWQGTFRTQNRGIFVTITDKSFEPKPGPYGDNIELTGVFLKVYRFTPSNTEEGEQIAFPHLIVKSIRRIPQTQPLARESHPAAPILAVFVVIVGIAMFIYVKGGRKGEERFEAWRAEKVRLRARAALGARLDEAAAAAAAAAPATTAPPPDAAPAPAVATPAPSTSAPAPDAAPPAPATDVAPPATDVAPPAPVPMTDVAPPPAAPAPTPQPEAPTTPPADSPPPAPPPG